MNDGKQLWQFSLTVYQRPGVADSCILLQDELQLDVNMMLCCLWLGSLGHRLDAQQMNRLLERSRPWQASVVGPLRSVRRYVNGLRSGDQPDDLLESLYSELKAVEILGERAEQADLILELSSSTGKSGHSDADSAATIAAANLRLYLQAEAAEPRDHHLRAISRLMGQAFPEMDPALAEYSLGLDPSP